MSEKLLKFENNGHYSYLFYCPACDMPHSFDERWTFNGDFNKPTFSPSLLVRYPWKDKDRRCHLFLTDGKIKYMNDCSHNMSGETIELQDWD